MEKMINKSNMIHRYIKSTLISVAIGEIITILLLLLFSFMICKMDFPLLVLDTFIIISACLGAITAGFLNGIMIKEKGMIFGILCGCIIILIMFLFNVSFHQLTSIPFLLLKIIFILLGSAFGGVIGVNKKNKRFKY